eukprot:TRINITY_DN37563_c2_g2_i1.p1 TRINITY_DN37563_c2_g2~~TRINITY_DN37563_c2_g2_i1.p1  ORF type:complete len:897 (-),score=192.13 TRINITY_DN37563_c2_g2_i1:72-2660(-)
MDEIPAAEFDGRDFDAGEVVQRYRRRVPLPQLQKSLRAHYAATRQEVVELINDKYADFVSLSSRMQGVERALRPLRAPLEESSELTQSLHSRLGAILQQAEDAHKTLADMQERKDALRAYIQNAKLLSKAKAAAAQRLANPQESDDLMRDYITQENVARDLRRIRLSLGSVRAVQTSPLVAVGKTGDGLAAETVSVAANVGASPQPPEWTALLAEAAEFEESFAVGLSTQLRVIVDSVKRVWEQPSQVEASSTEGCGGGSSGSDTSAASLPQRADLLAVSHLCRALVTLGRSKVVDEVFVEVFARQALEAATSACNGAPEGGSRDAASMAQRAQANASITIGAMDLGPFFDAIHDHLLSEKSPNGPKRDAPLLWLARRLRGIPVSGSEIVSSKVLDVTESGHEGEDALLAVPSLHLVANVAVAPVLQHVQKTWPNVFMPCFPDVFASNHAQASRFLRRAEALMVPQERRAFTEGNTFIDFQRRWKTQVYASLRSKEATQRFQTAAATATSAGAAVASGSGLAMKRQFVALNHEFWFEASAELLKTLETVWGDKWYLDALYSKTMQLSLELVARYGRVIRGIADSPLGGGGVGGNQGTDGAASGGWDAGAGTWAPTSLPTRLARAAADVLEVLADLACADGGDASSLGKDGATASRILSRAPGGAHGQAMSLARALLRESAGELQPALDALGDTAVRQVAAAVAPQFAAIRGIPAFYRMLNKPLPTKASPYVDSALRPVWALREVAMNANAFGPAIDSWIRKAVDEASAEFASQAAQLLESTRQQEASLRRLGRGGGGSGEAAQVSDLDKIHVQLCMDVDTFSKAATELCGGASSQQSLPIGLTKISAAVESVWPTYRTHKPA